MAVHFSSERDHPPSGPSGREEKESNVEISLVPVKTKVETLVKDEILKNPAFITKMLNEAGSTLNNSLSSQTHPSRPPLSDDLVTCSFGFDIVVEDKNEDGKSRRLRIPIDAEFEFTSSKLSQGVKRRVRIVDEHELDSLPGADDENPLLPPSEIEENLNSGKKLQLDQIPSQRTGPTENWSNREEPRRFEFSEPENSNREELVQNFLSPVFRNPPGPSRSAWRNLMTGLPALPREEEEEDDYLGMTRRFPESDPRDNLGGRFFVEDNRLLDEEESYCLSRRRGLTVSEYLGGMSERRRYRL